MANRNQTGNQLVLEKKSRRIRAKKRLPHLDQPLRKFNRSNYFGVRWVICKSPLRITINALSGIGVPVRLIRE
ncbi:MAG: hypothetical protein V3S02_02750 [Dehalococcoidales bacterium]